MAEEGRSTKVVGCHDDAVFVLDGDDGGARDDGRLCRCLRAAALEVRGIIAAIHVVSGLEGVSLTLMVAGSGCRRATYTAPSLRAVIHGVGCAG